MVAIDTLVSLICLIVGILGATAVIAMPAAASYALIGTSGVITILWIAMMISLKISQTPNQTQKKTEAFV